MRLLSVLLLTVATTQAQLIPLVNPFFGSTGNGLLTGLSGFLDFNEASGDAVWTVTPPVCCGGNGWDEIDPSTGAGDAIAAGTGVNGGSRDPDGTAVFYLNYDMSIHAIASDFTFSGWVKLGSLTGNQTLFAVWNPSDSGLREWRVRFIDATPDVFRFDVSDGGSTVSANVQPASAIATGTWYFVCAWIDGNTINITAEADGVGSLPTAGTAAIVAPIDNVSYGNMIGASGNPANVESTVANGGAFDMFGFWSRALTSAQRSLLYAKTPYSNFN